MVSVMDGVGVQEGDVAVEALQPAEVLSGGGVEVEPVLPGGYIKAWLSLVELLHYCALIGRELCHKELAQGTKSPLLGAFFALHWFFMA